MLTSAWQTIWFTYHTFYFLIPKTTKPQIVCLSCCFEIRQSLWWQLDRKDAGLQLLLAMPTMLYYVAVLGAK